MGAGAGVSRFLILRLDAPMMSFGGVMTDNLNRTDPAPGVSLITGLLGNALGYDHRDADALERLQARLEIGVRVDRPGVLFSDFQTVALGQPHHDGTGWTTRGRVEAAGGGSSDGTHIRTRDYYADACHTVALTLRDAEEEPTLDSIKRALRLPERPLFIGRKTCLPAAPLLLQHPLVPDGELEAADLLDALRRAPLAAGCERPDALTVWLPCADDAPGARVTRDRRDWRNQIHTGRRTVRSELISVRVTPNETAEVAYGG